MVFDRAVVGDVDAAAWVIDSGLKAKPEPFGLIDGVGDCPKEEDQGCDRDGDGADDRGPAGNRIQHDRPVRSWECKPAAALVTAWECRHG